MTSHGEDQLPPLEPQRTAWFAPASGLYLPELRVIVGHDAISAGMFAFAWTYGEGPRAQRMAVVNRRWRDAPQTVEETVQIAISGLQHHLGEAGDVFE